MVSFDILNFALKENRIEWRQHALSRMLARDITREDVKRIIAINDQVEIYPKDFPFPSALFVGSLDSRKLHVVASCDERDKTIYVITAYEPDSDHFEDDMRKRKEREI